MDLPLKVLCELGGWKNAQTVLRCYQKADEGQLQEGAGESAEGSHLKSRLAGVNRRESGPVEPLNEAATTRSRTQRSCGNVGRAAVEPPGSGHGLAIGRSEDEHSGLRGRGDGVDGRERRGRHPRVGRVRTDGRRGAAVGGRDGRGRADHGRRGGSAPRTGRCLHRLHAPGHRLRERHVRDRGGRGRGRRDLGTHRPGVRGDRRGRARGGRGRDRRRQLLHYGRTAQALLRHRGAPRAALGDRRHGVGRKARRTQRHRAGNWPSSWGRLATNEFGRPVEDTLGSREARGATIGGAQVHSLRLPSYVISVESIFGLPGERLSIRHDAGSSAEPYVGGTLLAARLAPERVGLTQGLDRLLFE